MYYLTFQVLSGKTPSSVTLPYLTLPKVSDVTQDLYHPIADSHNRFFCTTVDALHVPTTYTHHMHCNKGGIFFLKPAELAASLLSYT